MDLTKENLKADREVFVAQAASAKSVVAYIDGLIAFLDQPAPAIEPIVEPYVVPEFTEDV